MSLSRRYVLQAQRMTRPLKLFLAIGLALLAAPFSRADQPFAVNHSEPVTVRILSGKTGLPFAHVHLILIGGYDEIQMRDKLWREEAITDAQGQARLSKQFANLPWLQVWVHKKQLCQSNPGAASFSVERMIRDGLSTPNHCGAMTVEDTPGVFTVFVKGAGNRLQPEIAKIEDNPPIPAVKTVPAASPKAVVQVPAPPLAAPRAAAAAPPPVALDDAYPYAIPVAVRAPVFAASPARFSSDFPVYARVHRVAGRSVRKHHARRIQTACQAPQARTKPAAATPAKKPSPAKITPAKAESQPAAAAKPTAGAPKTPPPPPAKH
jgi:hypothetical protein